MECGRGQEVAQTRQIELEVRWQLEEQQPEFARLADRLQRVHELGDDLMAITQTFQVRDALRRLEAKAEALRRRGEPVFERARAWQLAEGVIHLNRVELGGIVGEKLLRRQARRIEVRLPRGVSPSRGAGKQTSRRTCTPQSVGRWEE